MRTVNPSKEDTELFKKQISENRYNFCKLVYIIFPFGEKGHELEFMEPYDWQMEEWAKLSRHLMNPETRYTTYRLVISSGNGAAKTAFGAMTEFMLMYTQQLRSRITANTDPQMKSVIWPEYDLWYRRARFSTLFFRKEGTFIKARNENLESTWRIDTVTWNKDQPSAISGLHNYGKACSYVLEEGPGIPAVIYQYIQGAFTEKHTIKIMMAFGNSDDPESYFEQCMTSPNWNATRIDTRTLDHIDQKQVEALLIDCHGNEDHDDFRVRVRGLPRKSSADAIISRQNVADAIERGRDFDTGTVQHLPVIISCDPAWQGGDECTIWYRQGHYSCLLAKYKLDRKKAETHEITYQKICYWEQRLKADAVNIDQGEGTGIYTLAMNAGKTSWWLVSFAMNPNDHPDPKMSQYANIRAQMYYEADTYLEEGGAIAAMEDEWLEEIQRQLCWTKGAKHKITLKKLAEAKLDIKIRVGQSPDIADGFVLLGARPILEKLPENTGENAGMPSRFSAGENAISLPEPDLSYMDSPNDLYG